ncbi:hypothetical protein JHK85_054136 [Glycine max]|nr:hypothetical protein JHK85_054136 [Glycine max]
MTRTKTKSKIVLFFWVTIHCLIVFTWENPASARTTSWLTKKATIPVVSEEKWSKPYAPFNSRTNCPSLGNSLGDLIANGAMAMNGGPDGVQMAISGCYAGPMFNTLMGLGLPLVLSAWSEHPDPYVTPKDTSLYETLLFLMGGVLWALVILPKKNMRLDKSLGAGLLSVYLCFLVIRIAMAVGIVKF